MASRGSKLPSFISSTAIAATMAFSVQGSAAEAQSKQIVIGASVPYLNDPSWAMIVSYANQVAKKLDVNLKVIDAQGQEVKQLADIQSLISSGANLILFDPVATADARSIVNMADKAKVPIIVVDRYPGFPANDKETPYLTFIGPDNAAMGRQVANYLFSHGVTKLVAIEGTPGDSNNVARVEGLKEAVAAAKDKGIKLVQTVSVLESEEHGYNAMQDLLSAHPTGTINGLWCYNDALCLGAYRAIVQANRQNGIIIGSMDLDAPALTLIKDHTSYRYDMGGHWLELGFAVMVAYDYLHGHPPLALYSKIEDLGVNSKQFQAFENEYIDHPPPIDIKHYMLTFNPNTKTQIPPLNLK